MMLHKKNNNEELDGLEEFKAVLDFTDRLQKQKAINVDKNWKNLQNRIHPRNHSKLWLSWIQHAAAILLLPLISVSVYFYLETVHLKSIPANLTELTAAYGTQSKVVLSDGSEVWLNSGSKLIYPDRFLGDNRQVTLSGEAFFKVKSDKEHRFDVKTSNGIVISAYGTEFNVEAYQHEQEISATLVKGCIGVEQTASGTRNEVKPGEKLSFSKRTNQTDIQKVNLLVETGWKDGKLIFRRTPLTTVVKQLSRRFNADFQLEGKELYNYTYSATFTTESLVEILSLLQQTAPIQYEVIYPKQHSQDHSFSKKKIIIRVN